MQEGRSRLHPIRQEPSIEPSIEPKELNEPLKESFQYGVVAYPKSPEKIDLADLWSRNPGLAKLELRTVAPGHKRLELVANGLGQWWTGPGINDFDDFLIQACQNRKKAIEQPSNQGDAKNYINNMIRNGDWANFALRCDEAQALRDRTMESKQPKQKQNDTVPALALNAQEKMQKERRENAIGLAKHKVAEGKLTEAKWIVDKFDDISYGDIGLSD